MTTDILPVDAIIKVVEEGASLLLKLQGSTAYQSLIPAWHDSVQEAVGIIAGTLQEKQVEKDYITFYLRILTDDPTVQIQRTINWLIDLKEEYDL